MWDETERDPSRPDELEEKLRLVERAFAVKGVSRRGFLKISSLVAAGLALPFGCTSPRAAEEACVNDLVLLTMPPPPAGEARAVAVGGGGIEAMVRRAIEMAGGLDEIGSGDTVAIKPNLTTASPLKTRVTTHPEVLRAVIRAVKERTPARNITVAEASSYVDPSTLEVARAVGIYDVVRSEGINFLAWEEEEYVAATCFDFEHIAFRLEIPVSLADSRFDHFINLPMLKNHDAISGSNADYTCCIKNHVGVLSRHKRIRGGGKGIHRADLGEQVAELNLTIPSYVMNVVDALTVVLSGGPASADMLAVDPGLILASRDRVACDSLALAVLRYYATQQGVKRPYVDKSVWEQAQIVRAQELNLGRSKGDIEVLAEGVGEIDGILAKWN